MRYAAAITRAARVAWFYRTSSTWAMLVAVCLGWLTLYSSTAGKQKVPPSRTDVQLPTAIDEQKFTLIVAIHPKCPCSRATVGEMERLLAQFHDIVQCLVLVYGPQGVDEVWMETGVVRTARTLPNAILIADVDARFARQFGITTSGGVVLYSPAGSPEYWGGITAARGHWGDNPGIEAIRAILSGTRPLRKNGPVFGCQICDDE